jgi:hypothetical protein
MEFACWLKLPDDSYGDMKEWSCRCLSMSRRFSRTWRNPCACRIPGSSRASVKSVFTFDAGVRSVSSAFSLDWRCSSRSSPRQLHSVLSDLESCFAQRFSSRVMSSRVGVDRKPFYQGYLRNPRYSKFLNSVATAIRRYPTTLARRRARGHVEVAYREVSVPH